MSALHVSLVPMEVRRNIFPGTVVTDGTDVGNDVSIYGKLNLYHKAFGTMYDRLYATNVSCWKLLYFLYVCVLRLTYYSLLTATMSKVLWYLNGF